MSIAEKLAQIAENEQKVYDAGFAFGESTGWNNGFVFGREEGYESGRTEGKAEGIEEGKQAEYDAFWDTLQENGTLTKYSYMFSGNGWTEKIFKPKYPIAPTEATRMFAGSKMENIDSARIDFSNCTKVDYLCFQVGLLKRFPELNLSNVTTLQYAFQQCTSLVTIDKIILPNYNNISNYNSFLSQCSKLENVVFEGTIGKLAFNLGGSKKLTHDSLMSVINALADFSEDTSGTKWVVTLGSTNLAKLTDAEKQMATDKGWTLA